MEEDRLSKTSGHPLTPPPDLVISLLVEAKCGIRHPVHARTSCVLPIGHGASHQCSTYEGESHEWA